MGVLAAGKRAAALPTPARAMDATSPAQRRARGRNPRGQGERLREEIVTTALRLLDELADDQALSLRAVAREIGIAATSVYLHFTDRDALVLAALVRCHQDLIHAADRAEAASDDPVAGLRARTLLQGAWARDHPGLYKVLHESTLNPADGHVVQGGVRPAGRRRPAVHGRRARPGR